MVDPSKVCFFIPPGLKDFKLKLFERIAAHIMRLGGSFSKGDFNGLKKAADDGLIPIVGCTPELKDMITEWRQKKKPWIYWDRGYARRVFATWLARGENGGFYRWHLNSFQMQKVRTVPSDRWNALKTKLEPWKKNPNGHIVVATPSKTYGRFHGIEDWTVKTLYDLALITKKSKRQIVVRDKESGRPLQSDLDGAYCMVTHGSNAAVESVISGCPVVVHADSAASLVGLTDMAKLETAIKYPDREAWVNSLAYCQFDENELVNGTLWRLME